MQTEGPMRRKKQKAKDNATGQPCASPSSWPVLTAGLDPLALPSVFSFFSQIYDYFISNIVLSN